jgi:5'-nucleotidase
MTLTVALDLDSTIYDLHTPWLAYLRDVLGEDVSGGFRIWDVHRQYPLSGARVYDVLRRPGLFASLVPLQGSVAAIHAVAARGDVRQVFVSTCPADLAPTSAHEKQAAVKRDFPAMAHEVLITSGSKDLVRADVLVDDAPHNLAAFPGLTVKIPYVYNHDSASTYTMADWSEYPALVERIVKVRDEVVA